MSPYPHRLAVLWLLCPDLKPFVPLSSVSLLRFEDQCRSYIVLGFTMGPPRVIAISFFAYPPSLLGLVTKRILGFDNYGYLTPKPLPYEGSLSFGQQIWLELSSDSSLDSSTPCFPLLWSLDLLSSDTLVFAYIFPPF